MRKALLLFCLLNISLIVAQVNQTANDIVPPYTGGFRPGMNLGIYSGFSDEELAVLSAGSEALQIDGVGVRALRPSLPEDFLEAYGYGIRLDAFAFYDSLQLKDNTLIVGYPSDEHRDMTEYCPGYPSVLFENLYEPIWDGGANGTPVNENNYFAKYMYETVLNYGDYVKFWEIWNEPGFDYTGAKGWLSPGMPGNWWENNPDPCDYKLRAPIFQYIRILRISYEVIKSLSPDDYVVLSGTGYPSFLDAILRNTDNPEDGSPSSAYPLGGGAYFDVMGYHSYPHFDGSLREWSNEIGGWLNYRHSDAAARGLKRSKDLYQAVLVDYGYDGLTYPSKLWTITECNLPRKAFGEFIGSTATQKNFIIKAFVECIKEDICQLHIYKIAEETGYEEATGSFNLMGMYQQLDHDNGYHQVANDEGIAYKTATDLLFGKSYDAVKSNAMALPDGVGGAALKDEFGNYTYVLWAETLIDQSEAAAANYSFPAAFDITSLLKRAWDYGTTNVSSWVQPLNIELTGTPLFFSEIKFNASTFHGCAPLPVQFNIPVLPGATQYEWSFETGLPSTSNAENPIVVFNTAGSHEVMLTIKNNNGDIISTQQDQISVEVEPLALFEYEIDGPVVNFTNLSSNNATQYEWNFGDGTSLIAPFSEHVFYSSGTFISSLVATNECGENEYSATISVTSPSPPQVSSTALDTIPAYDGFFRPGTNLKYFPPWTDEQLADIAGGNIALDISGVQAKSLRTLLPEYFLSGWGYDIRVNTFQHYVNLDLKDNVAILGFPGIDSRDDQFHCPEYQSTLFKDLYTDIWDNGENGTPVNDHNPYALYVWQVATHYKDYVKYWEIMNAPGYDPEGEHGWLPPSEPGNWWDNNPGPCDCGLRAPIFYYIRMLRTSYEIIKYVDSDAYIMLAGVGFPSFLDAILRNTDNPADGSIQDPYPLKGGAYFDVMGISAYPHVDGSTAGYDANIGTFAYKRHSDAAVKGIPTAVDTFMQVLNNYGFNGNLFPAKYFMVNEGNVARKSFENYFGSNLGQRNYEIKAIVTAMKAGILQFDFTNIAESEYYNDATNPDQLMGLYQKIQGQEPYTRTKTDGGKSFETTSKLLYGSVYDPIRTNQMQIPDNLDGAAFKNINGQYTYVLWAKTYIDDSEYTAGNYTFPASFGYNQLYKREWDFGSDDSTTLVSGNAITLTGTPIFLSESDEIIEPPIALFESTNATTGCPGMNVTFTNQSINASSIQWNFPGGSPASSINQNPNVVYNTPGTYPVHLTAISPFGEHTYSLLSYVEVLGDPIADFNYTIDGSWVQFINQSEGANSYQWTFGDSQTSVGFNPNIYFFNNGTYNVQLIAMNDCDGDTIVFPVTVQSLPKAGFDYTANSCGAQNVFFQNAAFGDPEQFNWMFEGGEPFTSTNPYEIVTYAESGIFTTTLIVSNEYGTDTLSLEVTIPGEVINILNTTVCSGNGIFVNGNYYDIAHPVGTEVIPSGTVNGCDSIIMVSLTFEDTITAEIHEELCQGQSFVFKGEIFNASNPSGTIFDNGIIANECDTLFQITTTTFPTDTTLIVNNLCFEDFTIPDTYQLLSDSHGCDSILHYHFEIIPTDSIYISETISYGNMYENGPYQFTLEGTYQMLFSGQNGCDSLVFLSLQVDSLVATNQPNPLSILQLTAAPNPLNNFTKVSFVLPEAQLVNIWLMDMTGRVIKEIAVAINMSPGSHTLGIDLEKLLSGVYMLSFISEKYRGALKLVKV